MLAMAALALLRGTDATAAETAGAMGAAFGVSVTSNLAGVLQAPLPAEIAGTVAAPGSGFGPVRATTGVIGLPGILQVGQIDAETGGTLAGSPTANSRAEVRGLSIAAGLLAASDLSSTCTSNPTAGSGSAHLDALTLGGVAVPVAPAANTVVDLPAAAHAVLNEQLPLDVAGGSGIVVRAVHLQVLPTSPGSAILDVVLAESRCAATASGPALSPALKPKGGVQPPTSAVGPAAAPSSLAPTGGASTPAAPGEGAPGQTASGEGGPGQTAPGQTENGQAPPVGTGSPSVPSSPPAPPARQPLSISPAVGPPGANIVLSAVGYGGCRDVTISFDGKGLGSARPDATGEFRESGVAVPGDASPGRHTIGASCRSGTRLERSTSFDVTRASVHRSAFVTSLRSPFHVPIGARALLIGFVAAGGAVLIAAFPSELFNSTLDANYPEIRGWFGLHPQPSRGLGTRHPGLLFAGFVLLGGVLFALLSPGFGFDLSTLALVLGLALSLVLITFTYRLPLLLHVRTRLGAWGSLRVLPGTALVAIACVAVSRLVHFQPGYMFGLIAGLDFEQEIGTDTRGRLTLLSSAALLNLGLFAWIVRTPLAEAAGGPNSGFWIIAAEACLAALFIGSLESVLFYLIPLRFLEGRKLTAWSRAAWAIIFGIAALAFVEILLQPASGYFATATASAQVITAAALFIGFGVFSVAFWAYFRFRPAAWRLRANIASAPGANIAGSPQRRNERSS